MSQQVPPTRMNLTLYKGKYVAAKKGYDLLKNKADALKVRFRDICKVIYETKVGMADDSSAAFFSLTHAEYAAGNFRSKVIESASQAQVRVRSRTDNVAGVKLPVFNQYETGVESSEILGLGAGGRKIGVCKEKFTEYLRALVKLASLQTSFVAMDEALKVTNRRVNALENVTIPNIMKIINEINRELDELEREDFTRLKVVKRKKEEAIKQEEKVKAAAAATAAISSATNTAATAKGVDSNAKSVVSETKSIPAANVTSSTPSVAPNAPGAAKKRGKGKNKGSALDSTEDGDVLFS